MNNDLALGVCVDRRDFVQKDSEEDPDVYVYEDELPRLILETHGLTCALRNPEPGRHVAQLRLTEQRVEVVLTYHEAPEDVPPSIWIVRKVLDCTLAWRAGMARRGKPDAPCLTTVYLHARRVPGMLRDCVRISSDARVGWDVGILCTHADAAPKQPRELLRTAISRAHAEALRRRKWDVPWHTFSSTRVEKDEAALLEPLGDDICAIVEKNPVTDPDAGPCNGKWVPKLPEAWP